MKGDMIVQATLVEAIFDLNDYFNISNRMTDAQTIDVVRLIMEKFNYFKLADFKLCFKNAKTGLYGKVYNRIDGLIIFEWLNLYASERIQVAETASIARDNALKNPKINPEEINPEGQKKVMDILSNAIEQTKADKQKDKKVNRGNSEYDQLVQSYFREFDEIYKKGRETNGTRFIVLEGKQMNQAEFIDFRLKQLEENSK